MSLFLKQTDLTNWKRFPQHPQIQTRHQWCTSDLRPRLSGLWQPFCSFCVSQRIQPGSSSTPLYFTLNSQSVSHYAYGPPSEPIVCFAEPASEIRGRTNVWGGQGWIAQLGLKKPLGLGVPEQSPTAWDSRTHLSYKTTGKAEAMGFLSLLDSLHLPKKPYGNRHTRQKQPGPREFSPLWPLHWRKSKCTVEILCVR